MFWSIFCSIVDFILIVHYFLSPFSLVFYCSLFSIKVLVGMWNAKREMPISLFFFSLLVNDICRSLLLLICFSWTSVWFILWLILATIFCIKILFPSLLQIHGFRRYISLGNSIMVKYLGFNVIFLELLVMDRLWSIYVVFWEPCFSCNFVSEMYMFSIRCVL